MFDAFRAMQQVHELRLLLDEAARLDLGPARVQQRERLLAQLEPATGWTAETLAAFDVARCQQDVHVFLRTLRDCVGTALRKVRRRLSVVG
jgi:hypothetical protein